MAGLISDIGSVANTFGSSNKIFSFGSDLLSNAGQSLGLTDTKQQQQEMPDQQTGRSSNGVDMRGMKQVFRDKLYSFEFQKDFRCFNNDFYFQNSQSKDWKNAIQEVILYEFQPYQQSQLGTQLKKMQQKVQTKEGKAALKQELQATFKGAVVGAKIQKNNFIEAISKNPQNYYTNTDTAWYNQVTQIRNFFRVGYWLNIYKLPGIGIQEKMFYLHETPSQQWNYDNNKTASDIDIAGDLYNKILNPIATAQNTVLKTPAWTPNSGVKDASFDVEFDLINDLAANIDNTSWTYRNFKFLQNFFTGTMPVSMPTQIMQSPNIYSVNIPGKCIFYWASVNIEVTCKGKQKVLPLLNEYLRTKTENKAIESTTLWPQIWHLKVTIKNLSPYSFTTYMDYLLNGNNIITNIKSKTVTSDAKLVQQNVMLGTEHIGKILLDKINGTPPKESTKNK